MDQTLSRADAPVVAETASTAGENIVALGNRRDVQARVLGNLVELNGLHGVIASRVAPGSNDNHWSVGHLITMVHGEARIVAVVCSLAAADRRWTDTDANIVHVKVELTGEIAVGPNGRPEFRRGLQSYPTLGAIAHRIRSADLAAIYSFRDIPGVEIGRLSQNDEIPAVVSIGQMVGRHFAVVGSTGVGKTTAVSILLQKSIEARKNLRVLIMDPHNEYRRHFPENSVTFDSATLDLPFWMFRFDELADIVFSGRDANANEREALFEVVKTAKNLYSSTQGGAAVGIRRASPSGGSASGADTPIPYRMADALQIVDGWNGMLEPPFPRADLRALKLRLETLQRDPRFRFMFGRSQGEDSMATILSRLFRMPMGRAPVSIVHLAGLPNEVLNAVVSVLARIAFDLALWSEGGYEILLVCEEAHRYIPNDRRLGFTPTRQAIGRIAKEGRKYGASLCVVSQRPSELDATVLSQCSTMFAMRLPNEGDKAIIKSALGEASATVLDFLSSIADQEAIAFGEAVPTPMRVKFARSAAASSMKSNDGEPSKTAAPFEYDMRQLVGRMRFESPGSV